MVAIPPKSSKLSRALCIQAKYSRKNKVYVSVEEKIRLASAARRYKAYCCYAYNEKRKIKYKLVYPYYYDRKRCIH